MRLYSIWIINKVDEKKESTIKGNTLNLPINSGSFVVPTLL